MAEIILKVTSKGLAYKDRVNKWSAAQIAITSPGFDANRDNMIEIEILLEWDAILSIGDTHAIWYSHNDNTENKRKTFKKLYSMLAKTPDKKHTFLYAQM